MLNRILYVIKILLTTILILITFIVIGLWYLLGNLNDEANKKRLIESQKYDTKNFPSLTAPLFFYKRIHVGDSGAWGVVYHLDELTKKQFIDQLKLQASIKENNSIECIKPTIQKRWKSIQSNIHYVVPDEWSRDHRDHEVHDSFIVYGSEKNIKIVEQACSENKFIVLDDHDGNRFHNYWAISEKENLLFSIYII